MPDDDFGVPPAFPEPTQEKPIIKLAETPYGRFVEKLTQQPTALVLVRCGSSYPERLSVTVEYRYPVDAGSIMKLDTNWALNLTRELAVQKLGETIEARATQIHCVMTEECAGPLPRTISPTVPNKICEVEIIRGEVSYAPELTPWWEITVTSGFGTSFTERYVVRVTAEEAVTFSCVCKDA